MKQKAELVIFKAQDGNVKLNVNIGNETVWLTQNQMSELFERDRSVIRKELPTAFFLHLSADDIFSASHILQLVHKLENKRRNNE